MVALFGHPPGQVAPGCVQCNSDKLSLILEIPLVYSPSLSPLALAAVVSIRYGQAASVTGIPVTLGFPPGLVRYASTAAGSGWVAFCRVRYAACLHFRLQYFFFAPGLPMYIIRPHCSHGRVSACFGFPLRFGFSPGSRGVGLRPLPIPPTSAAPARCWAG